MTSSRCSACSYAKAMQRAAKEVLLLALSSAVALALTFVALKAFISTEAARGIAEFLYRTAPIAFNTSMLIIVFSRVFDVATMQRYMREFNEPCPACGNKSKKENHASNHPEHITRPAAELHRARCWNLPWQGR